jgi:hypothetical protein
MQGEVLAVKTRAGEGFGFELVPEYVEFETVRETAPGIRDEPASTLG